MNWEESINSLLALYRDVERKALSLPVFSLVPFLISLWNIIKFEVFLFLDIFLLIPMNAIILIRNIFPGRWQYRSFSWRYIRYVALWVWRGETPMTPIAVVRPLVMLMLSFHAKTRLKDIQRRIYLDEDLSEEQRSHLVDRINTALEHWKQPGIINFIYTFVLPIAGPIIELYRFLFPGQLPDWMGLVGLMLIGYAIGFVITAFMVKRGLMLGGSGRSAYFPGAIDTTRYYSAEKQIIESIGVRKNEFQLDNLLLFINMSIGYLFFKVNLSFYSSIGLEMPPAEYLNTQMIIQAVVFILLIGFSIYRRKSLRRL